MTSYIIALCDVRLSKIADLRKAEAKGKDSLAARIKFEIEALEVAIDTLGPIGRN